MVLREEIIALNIFLCSWHTLTLSSYGFLCYFILFFIFFHRPAFCVWSIFLDIYVYSFCMNEFYFIMTLCYRTCLLFQNNFYTTFFKIYLHIMYAFSDVISNCCITSHSIYASTIFTSNFLSYENLRYPWTTPDEYFCSIILVVYPKWNSWGISMESFLR